MPNPPMASGSGDAADRLTVRARRAIKIGSALSHARASTCTVLQEDELLDELAKLKADNAAMKADNAAIKKAMEEENAAMKKAIERLEAGKA